MKNSLARAALSTALLLACPIHAAASIPASGMPPPSAMPKPPPAAQPPAASSAPANDAVTGLQKSPLWRAYLAVYADLKPLFGQDGNIKTTLEQLERFEFSTGTKKQLLDLFGNENPLHFKTGKSGNGNPVLSIQLDGLDYRDPQTGVRAHNSALAGKVTYNKRYTTAHATASMPLFIFDDGKTTQISAKQFDLVSNQKRGAYGLWIGTVAARLAHLTIAAKTGAFHLNIDGLSMKSDLKQHGKLLDIGYDYGIKSIHWGKDEAGPVHAAIRLVNIDGKEFAAIAEKARQLEQLKQTDAERVAAAIGLLKDFGLAAIKRGVAIEIQDCSVRYHKMTAGLNGRISFDNVQSGDFDSPKRITEKINARINVRVPMALVEEVSRVSARATLEAKSKKDGQPFTDAAVNQSAKDVVDKAMRKLLANKWIRIKRGMVLSTIEFKAGKLFVNDQPVAMPATPAVVPVPAPAPLPAWPVRPALNSNQSPDRTTTTWRQDFP